MQPERISLIAQSADQIQGTVQTAFEAAALNMADLPIVNPALNVTTLPFEAWGDYWIGVLSTPWCLNLLLVPRTESAQTVAVGKSLTIAFNGGSLDFLGAHHDSLGHYLSCSLLSPVHELENDAMAHEVAEAVLQQVGLAPEPETPAPETLTPEALTLEAPAPDAEPAGLVEPERRALFRRIIGRE